MFSKILNYLNDLSPRQLLILSSVAAAIMFVVIYFSLSFWDNNKEEVKEVVVQPTKKVEMVKVVSAKSDIAPRTRIQESMLQVVEMPPDSVPNGAITNMAEVVNSPARIQILAGDVITQQKVYHESGQAGFVGAIPPDCRAVSIGVNDITGVAGFAKPGDYVDLVLVEKDNKNASATSNILLQNVLLLSINKDMNADSVSSSEGESSSTNAISNPTIATFALRPDEILKLVSASKLGEIYLLLRPFKPNDMYVDAVDYTAYSSNQPEQTTKPEPAPAPQPAPVVTKPPKTPIVPVIPQIEERKFEIIQGDKIVQGKNKDKETKAK